MVKKAKLEAVIFEPPALEQLIRVLREDGYDVIGPAVRDGAIVLDSVKSSSELPAGWRDEQDAARYRLHRGSGGALFAYAAAAQPWKKFLLPPAERLLTVTKTRDGRLEFTPEPVHAKRYAFLGLRSCDLHAIAVQDRVLAGDSYPDTSYKTRRANSFLVAVNCGHPAASCFCDSMGTGPRCHGGYDVVLTEITEGGHRFLAEPGSEAGARALAMLDHRPATEQDLEAGRRVTGEAKARMRRRMDTAGIRELLYASVEHPRWEEVAKRCLACTNCTMVCPTCFCTTVEDASDLDGGGAERWRYWDSCFSQQFSYIHGGSVRHSIGARYRQWLTHKFASWQDQFGSSGCVGCGRCITWCPAGIDVTEEVRAIRETARGG